eukprot:10720907-Heterocapsa_arctica.AAC.1
MNPSIKWEQDHVDFMGWDTARECVPPPAAREVGAHSSPPLPEDPRHGDPRLRHGERDPRHRGRFFYGHPIDGVEPW